MSLEARRAADRPVTVGPGRHTTHGMSFGAFYDPEDVGFGPIVAFNDERLQPAAGYAMHRHRDVQIVTWVVEGSLVHRDQHGEHRLVAGEVQVFAAGDGATHEETTGDVPVRFVQMWLVDDAGPAQYERASVDVSTRWEVLAGARAPVGLRGPGTLAAARPRAGDRLEVPACMRALLFCTRGRIAISDETGAELDLGDGDALRLEDEPTRTLIARADAEVLLWTFTR